MSPTLPSRLSVNVTADDSHYSKLSFIIIPTFSDLLVLPPTMEIFRAFIKQFKYETQS
jgi:hypothetical protein